MNSDVACARPLLPPAIELVGIDKHFGPVHANRNVHLRVAAGTIHGIVGENGAGKSTLVNILYGFYRADRGRILIDGLERRITGPADAIRAGIGMVHQHVLLVESFTVLENILLGCERGFTLKRRLGAARREIEEIEREYGLAVPLDATVADLPVGMRQRVQILKALFRSAHILVLDEPTNVLTPQESNELFRILRRIQAQGRTVVLVTHKLREIMAVTDAVSVMRRGEMVAHRRTAETTSEELAELMVGRKVRLRVEKGPARPREPVLEVDRLEVEDDCGVTRVRGVTFTVRAGEIVAVAGVAGNGQAELLEVLAGMRRAKRGQVYVRGRPLLGARKARQHGVAHVPEDRQRVGLLQRFAAFENIVLGYHADPRYQRMGLMRRRRMIATCLDWMARYDVHPADPFLPASAFSGGNQQKLVLARELEHQPDLLLVSQPTRGVDVGAIEFIHTRLIAMRDAGKAVLLVSVELDEILSLADRILVMCDGRIVGEFNPADADEGRLGLLMAGVTDGARV